VSVVQEQEATGSTPKASFWSIHTSCSKSVLLKISSVSRLLFLLSAFLHVIGVVKQSRISFFFGGNDSELTHVDILRDAHIFERTGFAVLPFTIPATSHISDCPEEDKGSNEAIEDHTENGYSIIRITIG